MDKNSSFLKTKPMFPLLVSMAVPMMLSMLIQSLYNIVDSIYVARLGTKALTAVSLAYPLQNAVLSVAVGVGVGISSAISIHLGAERQEEANRAATIGVALTVFHCVRDAEVAGSNPVASILITEENTGVDLPVFSFVIPEQQGETP